ncbi:uncharacterized protein B0H64DRAFT_442280 [Chaetomium fimeti]|uniref:Zn(2)-C6 fungal-type domain-containing protein n=1 Tax=Chaetomium fimeti TaxID=1854472 RepID=A0AAE0HGK3_9PEZI|nr:hypothetical protein B0H64DRAFT_442280 [Chaetomium fimeti]
MASGRVTAFANTFLVANHEHGGPALKVVGPQETRKKRPHRCDEGDPCRNCVKRKETCVRLSPASPNRGTRDTPPMTSPPPEVAWCPLSEPECRPINLLHMELLHHFERYSIPTLPFQEVWPRMLQLAFQARQHTYLVNAMLAFAAAHLDYLHGAHAQYHRAKYALLDKALHDYRGSLSEPITPANCDALLGTANLIQYLMWCDLSFMEGQQQEQQQQQQQQQQDDSIPALNQHPHSDRHPRSHHNSHHPSPQPPTSPAPFTTTPPITATTTLPPLFSSTTLPPFSPTPLFSPTPPIPPKAPEKPLDLSTDRLYFLSTGVRQIFFMAWPLFQSRQSAFTRAGLLQPCVALEDAVDARGLNWRRGVRAFMGVYDNGNGMGMDMGMGASGDPTSYPTSYLEGLRNTSLSPTDESPYRIMTLWQSHKEGDAYLENAGAHDEALVRAAYKRLATRVSVALAFVMDGGNRGGPASKTGGYGAGGHCSTDVKSSDLVRYVTTFPMMCFGPLLAMISSGDSRMLVLLFHIYRVTGALLTDDTYWWCKKRVEVMGEAIGRELRSRGLEVCLRRQGEFI